MTNARTLLPFAVAVALGALLVSTRPSAAEDDAGPTTHTITIDGMEFHPDRLTVHAGDTVTWINKDFFPHTATSASGGFDSGSIAPDGMFSQTLTTKGDFDYLCALHTTMKGSLKVE